MEEEYALERDAEDIARNYIGGTVSIRITNGDYAWVKEHPYSAMGILAAIFDGIIFNYELTKNDKIHWIKFDVLTKDDIRHNIESMNLNFNSYQEIIKLKDAYEAWGVKAEKYIDDEIEQFMADYVAELANKSETGHWQAYRTWCVVGAVNTDLAYVTGRFDEIRPYNED